MRWLARLLVFLLVIAFGPPLSARLLGYDRDESMLPPRGREVRIGENLFLNVLDTGSGPPIVLVHGLPSSAYDWAGLPMKLAALGHRVLVYDRVGYGYSTRAPDAPDRYTYQSNANDLVRLLDVLGIPRATLVGWSYGGAVVEMVAQTWPDRVTHLILVAAVGPKQPQREQDLLERISESPLAVPLFRWVGSVPPLSRAVVAEQVAEAFSPQRPPIGWADYTRTMMSLPGTLESFVLEDRRSAPAMLEPEKITAPTLVIHGRGDKLVPLEVGQDLETRIPDARLFILEDGGHMLPVTHPDLLAKEIHQHSLRERARPEEPARR
ncbi:MAG TPA: alpha/beta hydrolase [Candidatus Limnocylindrales bacterium]|nr:alpha/beta hydrolase [Candidatus Limnocylindrales bacterium]